MDLDTLIANNMGLVYKQLHKFNLAYDDEAFSYAMEALMKAAKTYDETKDVAFSTYATVCIYNGVAMYLREMQRTAKLPVVHYEEPVPDGSGITLADMLSDGVTPETVVMRSELYSTLWNAFSTVLDGLSCNVSKDIILMWKESDFMATQREIADALGVSQPHVSRTLSAFKYKLKKEMEDYLCKK